jgi:hypothetical protein
MGEMAAVMLCQEFLKIEFAYYHCKDQLMQANHYDMQ